MTCCSSHSVKKLARIGDTGLPMGGEGGVYRVTLHIYRNN